MTLHSKGWKAERDRAVLNASLDAMYKEFRTPRAQRLTPEQRARMTTEQLYRASKDPYSLAPVKRARRLAVKMGLAERTPTAWDRVKAWVWRALLDPHPERSELHSKTREAQRA